MKYQFYINGRLDTEVINTTRIPQLGEIIDYNYMTYRVRKVVTRIRPGSTIYQVFTEPETDFAEIIT